MKLIRLKLLVPFHGLPAGFEYVFRHANDTIKSEPFAPFVCAGPNGSGKSNLLEVLAAIFYHLRCKTWDSKPRGFIYDEEENPKGYKEEESIPDGFELEYYCCNNYAENLFDLAPNEAWPHILIEKRAGDIPEFFLLNRKDTVNKVTLGNRIVGKILPQYVVAYSSGENEILSLPFLKMRFLQYDAFIKNLEIENTITSAIDHNFVYMDQSLHQALLLSLFLLGDEEDLAILKSTVGVENLSSFRITLRDVFIPNETKETEERIENTKHLSDICNIFQGIHGIAATKDRPFTPNMFENLLWCSTAAYSTTTSDEKEAEDSPPKYTRTFYLDFWVNEETRKAFKHHFKTPRELFNVFYTLLMLNFYSVSRELKTQLYTSDSPYLHEIVPRLPVDQRFMNFTDVYFLKNGNKLRNKDLSDGEHQFLHALSLCCLYKNTGTLFLLDEPETHFNPEWRSQFITNVKRCLPSETEAFLIGSSKLSEPLAELSPYEMLITTHSPFLISDSTPDKVLVFNKDEKGTIRVTNPEYNTLGASIDDITMKTLNKGETIGNQAILQMQNIYDKFKNGENPQELIEKVETTFGDSIEKMFLLRALAGKSEKE